jgi:hypothetical protein
MRIGMTSPLGGEPERHITEPAARDYRAHLRIGDKRRSATINAHLTGIDGRYHPKLRAVLEQWLRDWGRLEGHRHHPP